VRIGSRIGTRLGAAACCGAGVVAVFVGATPSAFADPVAPAPPPPPQQTLSAAAGGPTIVPPPNGTPHLYSPSNLPPGTSADPTDTDSGSYLRDLWHAVQTQEISGKDALLLFTQRRMTGDGTLPPGELAGPQPGAPVPPPPPPTP
jgi:hypothetical protein